jgi:hypothetical protein
MEKNITFNEKTIEDTALYLPKLPPKIRKNFFDILGVQRKETINSKVLAYFLDANEEHRFNTLFIDALKKLINIKFEKKSNDFEGEFSVTIEDATAYAEDEELQQKRIDILIVGIDWCIIIENKLYHTLQNPLETYWEHIHKKYPERDITGIVLSLKAVKKEECAVNKNIKYINITHKEWVEQIQKDLLLNNYNNDTDIFYLREYLKTIASHYPTKKNKGKMNKILQALVKQRENIKIIEATKTEANVWIKNQIEDVFARRGFKKNDYGNFCHPNFNEKGKKLLFRVYDKDILKKNCLKFELEIWNTEKSSIVSLIDDFNKLKEIDNCFVSLEKKIANENGKIQLPIYESDDFINEQTNFSKDLEKILDDYFFNAKGIVELTENFFGIKSYNKKK